MECLKWADVGHFRHAKLVALQDDKVPRDLFRNSMLGGSAPLGRDGFIVLACAYTYRALIYRD